MTIEQTLLAFLLLGLAFVIGWEVSARRGKRRYQRLNARLVAVRAEIEQLTDAYTADPTRAAINVGQQYVLDRVEQLCTLLRNELPSNES